MTPQELEEAQEKLGLSQVQLARALGMADRSYRYLIAGEREISGPVSRLVVAFLNGYRPDDWPADKA